MRVWGRGGGGGCGGTADDSPALSGIFFLTEDSPMRDEDALLAAIDAEPHDDLPRLAYADWLEENGDVDRAEFIRIQCRLAELSPLDAGRVPLEVRETELLGQHEPDWLRRARGSAPAAGTAGGERGVPVV